MSDCGNWRTTWRGIIVPLLAPLPDQILRRGRTLRQRATWQPTNERKLKYEIE